MDLVFQTDQRDQPFDLLSGLRGFGLHAPEFHRQSHVVIDIQSLQQIEVLEDHAHVFLQEMQLFLIFQRDLDAIHFNAAGLVVFQAVDAAKQCRFSGTRLTDDAEDLVIGDLDRDVLENFQITEVL